MIGLSEFYIALQTVYALEKSSTEKSKPAPPESGVPGVDSADLSAHSAHVAPEPPPGVGTYDPHGHLTPATGVDPAGPT